MNGPMLNLYLCVVTAKHEYIPKHVLKELNVPSLTYKILILILKKEYLQPVK